MTEVDALATVAAEIAANTAAQYPTWGSGSLAEGVWVCAGLLAIFLFLRLVSYPLAFLRWLLRLAGVRWL